MHELHGYSKTGKYNSGFSFENVLRNSSLLANGYQAPKPVKTGTTICGVIFNEGVVLGADTRATEDNVVADKNCMKIHCCCGAGTAADCDKTTQIIAAQLELHALMSGRTVPVVVASTLLKQMLFRYQGYLGCALVLGGVDNTGSHLHCIYPHGSEDTHPYCSMGSGSLAAMAVLESRWQSGLELEAAKQLVRDAIAAGIFNDLASGSNVDLCVITKSGAEMFRPYNIANLKGKRQGLYDYAAGTTGVLSTSVIPIDVQDEWVLPIQGVHSEEMETTE